MQILCSLSSIEFSCDHFPARLFSREISHPIFSIPQRKLITYLPKWSAGELTQIDSYLLFLAALSSTDLVEFRVPAIRTEQTDAVIANNMESLFRTINHINTVSTPENIFARVCVSPDTKTLANVHHWIESWEDRYQSYVSGKHRDIDDRKLAQKEALVTRLILNPHKPVSQIAPQIADWAAIAGSFPPIPMDNPYPPHQKITVAEYWKFIIIKCARAEALFSIPRRHIQELLDHCEDSIPIGTIQSHKLFKILRDGMARQKNFLGLGDLDAPSSRSFTILDENTSIEDANLKAMIDSAPAEEPRQEQYPTKFAFMKAKMNWELARKSQRSGE